MKPPSILAALLLCWPASAWPAGMEKAGPRPKRTSYSVPAATGTVAAVSRTEAAPSPGTDTEKDLAERGFPEEELRAGSGLLEAVRRAEREGAVDYLKDRLGSLRGLVLRREEPGGGLRLLLTARGYEKWISLLSRDAIAFFEKKGMDFRVIFALRDLRGSPFFTARGRLTGEGAAAYLEALGGSVVWILPHEATPGSPEARKNEAEKTGPPPGGYIEISEPEYFWLLKVTDCLPEVMREPPLFMKEVRTPKLTRYYLCGPGCPYHNRVSAKLLFHIEDYREGRTHIPDSGGTAFFGRGGVKPPRLCVNGRVFE